MSKERARAAPSASASRPIKAAARAAEAERRERARRPAGGRSPRWLPRLAAGQPGLLAAAPTRRPAARSRCACWSPSTCWSGSSSSDWAVRVLALLVSLLAAPVLHILLFRRR